ncbi:hypothetical protein D623_10018699 [Myotis brandtii]|uniref:Uncharacterized protein n=1 Tax=Myotis brandtii TaxID=109478 RepID=S7PWG7_MYOBR|nr:hypothetical protein D623_10018699 [Myotis brandtii]
MQATAHLLNLLLLSLLAGFGPSQRIPARNTPLADVLRFVAENTGAAACNTQGTAAEADSGPLGREAGVGERGWGSSAAFCSWRDERAQQVLITGDQRQEGESWEGCGVAWLSNSENQPAPATGVNAEPLL